MTLLPDLPPAKFGGDRVAVLVENRSGSRWRMKAKDVMSAPVLSVLPETPVPLAAKLLAGHGYCALPVVDQDDHLLGLLTAAELEEKGPLPRLLGVGQRPEPAIAPPLTVGRLMRTDVLATEPDTPLATLARAMLAHEVHAIPIVDAGVVVGIVTRHDLLRLIARDDQVIASDVRDHLSAAGYWGWAVTVVDGMVMLCCADATEMERRIAVVIVGSLPGVVGVRVIGPAE